MKTLGRYCKAYKLGELRASPDFARTWTEKVVSESKGGADDGLTDSSIVFLQEDFSVTAGIFYGERIIYDGTSEPWKNYCRDQLKFSVPADLEVLY